MCYGNDSIRDWHNPGAPERPPQILAESTRACALQPATPPSASIEQLGASSSLLAVRGRLAAEGPDKPTMRLKLALAAPHHLSTSKAFRHQWEAGTSFESENPRIV